jgi:hypothetical protein
MLACTALMVWLLGESVKPQKQDLLSSQSSQVTHQQWIMEGLAQQCPPPPALALINIHTPVHMGGASGKVLTVFPGTKWAGVRRNL